MLSPPGSSILKILFILSNWLFEEWRAWQDSNLRPPD